MKRSVTKLSFGIPQARTWITAMDPSLDPQTLETLSLMSTMQHCTCDMKCLLWLHHHGHPLLVISLQELLKCPIFCTTFWFGYYTLTFTTTAISEHKVSGVPPEVHCRVMSLAQDIMYSASHGRLKQVHMAIRHLSGSKQVINLLNHFGHGVSATQLEEFKTCIAE